MSGENRSLEIVIVGAGIAGLAVAYGLLELPGVHVRILERRKGVFNSTTGAGLIRRGTMRTGRIPDPSFACECTIFFCVEGQD